MSEEKRRDDMLGHAVKCERCKSKPGGQVVAVPGWYGVWCSNPACKGHVVRVDLRTSAQALARWNNEQARIAKGELA